jgi:hypothetical protein
MTNVRLFVLVFLCSLLASLYNFGDSYFQFELFGKRTLPTFFMLNHVAGVTTAPLAVMFMVVGIIRATVALFLWIFFDATIRVEMIESLGLIGVGTVILLIGWGAYEIYPTHPKIAQAIVMIVGSSMVSLLCVEALSGPFRRFTVWVKERLE